MDERCRRSGINTISVIAGEKVMTYHSLNADIARCRQSDLRAAAEHARQVKQCAGAERTARTHAGWTTVSAMFRRLRPVGAPARPVATATLRLAD
jgi:hypothetical protein